MKNLLKKMKEENGFTLVEMAIVLVIIAALLLLIIPNVGQVGKSVDENTAGAIVTTVESQATLYKLNGNSNSVSLETLKSNGYITQKQLDAYNAADSDLKSMNLPDE